MHPQQQGTQAILRIISMAENASRQYDARPVYLLATRLSLKDVPILPFEIFRLGPARKRYLFGHEINPLLTHLVRSRWLDIGLLVLFCVVWVKHFFGYLVYEIFLCPESWRGSLHMYLLSFPRFWTLSIERF